MRCLRILVLTTICPILRYYIGDTGGEVGGEVAGDKDYTGGAVWDARRGVGRGTQGVTQVMGRWGNASRGIQGAAQATGCKVRRKLRGTRRGASRGTQGAVLVVGRKAQAGRGAVDPSRGESIPLMDEPSSGCVRG
jgi:hypothetical protein